MALARGDTPEHIYCVVPFMSMDTPVARVQIISPLAQSDDDSIVTQHCQSFPGSIGAREHDGVRSLHHRKVQGRKWRRVQRRGKNASRNQDYWPYI